MKYIIVGILIIFISCNTEVNFNEINNLVIRDTIGCNFIAKGNINRSKNEEGQWEFYKDKLLLKKGTFSNGLLVGIWEYNFRKINISWEEFNDTTNKIFFSFPSNFLIDTLLPKERFRFKQKNNNHNILIDINCITHFDSLQFYKNSFDEETKEFKKNFVIIHGRFNYINDGFKNSYYNSSFILQKSQKDILL